MDHQVYSIFDKDRFIDLTKDLKIAQCMKSEADDVQEESNSMDPVNTRMEELLVSDKLFCSFCNVAFEDKVQQRLHYKLDWHRYNLKQNLMGRSLVSEEEFQHLADDVSSISGSESDSEDSEENEEDSQNVTLGNNEQKNRNVSHKSLIERHSKVFFENADGKILSVYRCVLHDRKMIPENDKDIVTTALQCIEKPKWAVIMLGGGHFAAAIFDGKEAVVHKSFHSYTVRARQGGTQSSRDGRSGGSHPKSAGASLRRYNEASFNQHVQDILTEWINHLEACSLIVCRAVGHNRSILFGGRNPPLSKTDPRVRTIPFSTRRATFKEIQRVHATLSTLEVYGSANDFQTSFPVSPKKSKSKTSIENKDETIQQTDSMVEVAVSKEKGELTEGKEEKEGRNRSPRQKKSINRAKSRPSPHRPLPEIVTEILAQSSPDVSDPEGDVKWTECEQEVNLQQNLQEFEDTVPQWVKDKKAKKPTKQVKKKSQQGSDSKQTEKYSEAVRILRQKLLAACKLDNSTLLQECLKIERNEIPETSSGEKEKKDSKIVTLDELHQCLNEQVLDNGSTLLHIAAENGSCELLRCLLEAGCDPCVKNKKSQPPFAVSADRETRNTFRKFVGEFPDKYDYRKSQIPGPLTDEMERELAEKQKEIKKAKRARERERKKEETDKDRFLKLSDREKRALAAERRILESNVQGRSNIKVVTRCFECATDITGKVPFEYDIHRFCTIECLKRHRQKLKMQQK